MPIMDTAMETPIIITDIIMRLPDIMEMADIGAMTDIITETT